jgi:hypothetical protein
MGLGGVKGREGEKEMEGKKGRKGREVWGRVFSSAVLTSARLLVTCCSSVGKSMSRALPPALYLKRAIGVVLLRIGVSGRLSNGC